MDNKLYFVTLINGDSKYEYIYIIADSRAEAKERLKSEYSFLKLISIRALYPSKRNLEKINLLIKKMKRL